MESDLPVLIAISYVHLVSPFDCTEGQRRFFAVRRFLRASDDLSQIRHQLFDGHICLMFRFSGFIHVSLFYVRRTMRRDRKIHFPKALSNVSLLPFWKWPFTFLFGSSDGFFPAGISSAVTDSACDGYAKWVSLFLEMTNP